MKLNNCKTDNLYLPFEFSDVNADIQSHIEKINNSFNGKIIVNSYGECIKDDDAHEFKGVIEIRSNI